MNRFEVAHQIGLLPGIAMAIFGRKLPARYWLLAAAFSVSWLADSLAKYLDGSWTASYVWIPIQMALVLVALLEDPMRRLFAVTSLAVVAFGSAALSWPGPDVLVTLGGSVAVLALASGPAVVPLYLYFGAGSVSYLWMIGHLDDVLPGWYAYQASRLSAYLAFAVLVSYLDLRRTIDGGRV